MVSRHKERDVRTLLITALLLLSFVMAGMQAFALVELQNKIDELELAAESGVINTGLSTPNAGVSSSSVGSLPGMVGGC